MRKKTWFSLVLLSIYSVTGGFSCSLNGIQDSTTCAENECPKLVHQGKNWACPDGFHIEYKGASDAMETSTSFLTCIEGQYVLNDDRSVKFSASNQVTCRENKGLGKGAIVGIIVCGVVFISAFGAAIWIYLKHVRGATEKENVEAGKTKEAVEVSARSVSDRSARSKSTEPTSGAKKPSSSMESPNKKSSDNEESEKSRGSAEQRSRGSKEKGKSKEGRGSKEKRGGSKGSKEKREKTEEGEGMDKGRKGKGGSKESRDGKRPRVRKPSLPHGNTLKEAEQAKLNQRKGKLPVPNLAKCDAWDDALFEEILKVWMNFSINERIGFCEQMLRKMNGMIAVQFMRLFQNALFVETDRRVWTKLHECFRLLYAQCEAEYYMNICERMYQTVAATAADKLNKMGWQEKANDNVDDAYIRYICTDLVLFDCQTDNIAKLYTLYDEKKFSFESPLRIAVWTRVVREDDLANEKIVLQQFLFEEAKLPRVKLPNEEYGSKLQHLIYAASTSKEANFTKELWKRLVTEKEIPPADLVFIFKGTMIYPNARKRCLDLFMEEAFFRDKIPSDCPEYKEILRLFANSCVREAELQKIKDHVMADFAFTDADKKSFDFEMLEKRMAAFLKDVPTLHATMNKYLIEDRDFLVHKK